VVPSASICKSEAPATKNIVTVIARMTSVVPRFGCSITSRPMPPMMTTNGMRPPSKLRRLSPLPTSQAAR
jgi:hypothetical protein